MRVTALRVSCGVAGSSLWPLTGESAAVLVSSAVFDEPGLGIGDSDITSPSETVNVSPQPQTYCMRINIITLFSLKFQYR